MKVEGLPLSERYTLSIAETAAYFGIGTKKMYQIVNENRDADFILEVGSHRRIKREKFEKFIDDATTI